MKNNLVELNLPFSAQTQFGQGFIDFINEIPWDEFSNVETTLVFYHLNSVLKNLFEVKSGSEITALRLYLKKKQDQVSS